jgi:hypothetical protein
MKYIISESKLESFIREYLNTNMRPDNSFMPDLHWTGGKARIYGKYTFIVNHSLAYSYINGVLYIQNWLVDKLNGLFGTLWQPIFKTWFEDITSLEVEGVVFGK